MRNCKNHLQVLLFFVVFSLLLSTSVIVRNASAGQDGQESAQSSDSAVSKPESAASQEELTQILAPIALYPDSLLAQMFMAATYPLEIVEAARFVKQDPSLKEDALDEALKEKNWDVSVKSLCHFPTVVASMNDNLEATKRLGDYFLDDQKAVMDMVQTLRAKAKAEGNLETTEEQKVIIEEKIIIIESANPEVVYVPYYNSTIVYGSWWYPAYPPYLWYPPPPRYGFAAGVIIGAAAVGWCHPNWRRGDIDVDINRTANFNKNVNINHRDKGNRKSWKHNPQHRQGVAYNNRDTRKRFGQSDRAAKKKDIGRGHASQGLDRKTRDSIKKQGVNSNNRQQINRKQEPGFNQKASRSADTTKRDLSGSQRSVNRSRPQQSNAFKSSDSGRRTSQMSQRGSASRNVSRGGGGGRGGGRRR